MEIKTVPAYKVIFKSTKTNLTNLSSAGRLIADELGKLIEAGKITPIGPMQWNYYGMPDNNPDREFELEIAIPVNDDQMSIEGFVVKELPTFKCAMTEHDGEYDSLGKTYEALMEEVLKENQTLTGDNREIYRKMDSENAGNNITEIQMGIE